MTLCDIKTELKKLEDNTSAMIMSIAGAIEKSAVEQVAKKFVEFLSLEIKSIILVCSKIEYINSTGMGLLMQMYDEFCEQRGGAIKLVAVPKLIATNFKLLNMNSFFEPYYATVEDALKSFTGQPADVAGKISEGPVPGKEPQEKVAGPAKSAREESDPKIKIADTPKTSRDDKIKTADTPKTFRDDKIKIADTPKTSRDETEPKKKIATPPKIARQKAEPKEKIVSPVKTARDDAEPKEKIVSPSKSARDEAKPKIQIAGEREKEGLLREGIFGLLKSRFGAISGKLQNGISQVTSAADLETLLRTAATTESLEEFSRKLNHEPSLPGNKKNTMSIEIKITY